MSERTPLRVLLISDAAADGDVPADLFDPESSEASLHRARSLDEGARRLREESFDVCLLDLGTAGPAPGEAVYLCRDAGGAPVVALSGPSQLAGVTEALRAGAEGYLRRDELDAATLERFLLLARDRFLRRREMEASEQRMSTLVEMAPVGIVVFDLETDRIVGMNRQAAEIVDRPVAELLNAGPEEIDVWEDLDRRRELVERVREEGGFRGEHAWFRDRSGRRRHVRLSARRLTIRGRERVMWTVEDRTEERERDERFRQMAENIEEVFWLRDPDSQEFLYVSPAYETIWGRPVEELYEKPRSWLEAVHPEDRSRVTAVVLGARSPTFELDYRIRRPDGEVRWIRDRAFPVEDRHGQLLRVAGVARDVTAQKRMEARLRRHIFRDPLTGLPNRQLLEDRLEHALAASGRRPVRLGLLMLGVERLRRVDRSLGHKATERVLREVARRLRGCMREEDTVARWGGDEFAVLLTGLEGEADIETVRDRIRDRMGEPVAVSGETLRLNVDIGAVFAVPGDEEEEPSTFEAEEIIRWARRALEESRGKPDDGFHLYRADEVEDGEPPGRLRLERDLRRAVAGEELEVHYQPIVRLATGEAVGVEALARWRHPRRGWIPPVDFIPLAEETDVVHDLGRLVLRSACRRVAAWNRDGSHGPPLFASVNVSGAQFEAGTFTEDVLDCLRETGLEAERLRLEVTKSSFFRTTERIEELREAGVRIVIDDFGTGYSSLLHLRELDVDALNIDMTFVHGLGAGRGDTAIVEAILTLGREMGLEVVAEGVETEAQLRKLREKECALGQGYLFARPGPGDEMERWLRNNAPGGH